MSLLRPGVNFTKQFRRIFSVYLYRRNPLKQFNETPQVPLFQQQKTQTPITGNPHLFIYRATVLKWYGSMALKVLVTTVDALGHF